MTLWILAALTLALLVLPLLVLGRSGRLKPLPFEPLSTLHTALRRKQSKKTRAALDAATVLLQ